MADTPAAAALTTDDDSLGWQKSPQSPEQFGNLADRLDALARRIDNIESRVVEGTVTVKNDEEYITGFGIAATETALARATIQCPSTYSQVAVVANCSGRAIWDYEQGGTAGTGDWMRFFSRLSINGVDLDEGSSELIKTITTTKNNQVYSKWAQCSFGAPSGNMLFTHDQVGDSLTVELSAWTNWASAFHSDVNARARLQLLAFFIR